jgi:hypothetical protein
MWSKYPAAAGWKIMHQVHAHRKTKTQFTLVNHKTGEMGSYTEV